MKSPRTIGFVAALLAIAAIARPVQAAPLDRAAEGAVVVMATTESERGTGAGTIVAISGANVRIITAKHVATFGRLSVRFGGVEAPARLLSFVPGEDIAVIEATLDPVLAAGLHAAPLGTPRAREAVHVWGSGFDGPAFEAGSVTETGGVMPDGAAAGRYELACALCHRGDSGGGVFDAAGSLVGVYIGYFTYDSGRRVSVAAVPVAAVRTALETPFTASRLALASGPEPKMAIVASTDGLGP